jgi:tRNA nucleotidyltransferase (CCA-adding enzyme)
MNRLLDLPTAQRRAIEAIKEIAVEKDLRPFLVGGPVRDLILGRRSIDIDVTLEDGASTLARTLAKRIEGRVRSFPQFLTYKVTADGFPEIDITTARKERYRTPGALPIVSAGRLKDDLMRRDFSVNAIALALFDGTQHDPAGGEQDIRDRLIRVFHDQSFIDDPTRIFRAVRLATRLGFTIEPHTASLMRSAIECEALRTVSRERVWRELFLAMDEHDAPAVLAALHEEGALVVLFGRRGTADLRATLEAVRYRIESDASLDRHVIYTGLLLRGDASPIDFEGAGFSQKRARAVVEIANELPRFHEALEQVGSERQRFRLYRGVSPEMLTVIAAERPDESPRIERWREYKQFTIPLRGNDLEVPSGPHIAKALERTREAVFNGEIEPDEARTFAREMAKKYREQNPQSEP